MSIDVAKLNEFIGQLELTKFEDYIIRMALAHDKKIVEHLESANAWTKGHGQGKLLEYYVYEMIKHNIGRYPYIEKLVIKGRDVPYKIRNSDGRVKNGLCYDTAGNIVLRGNGLELAEFDLMMLARDGSVIFGEVFNSARNVTREDKEFSLKRKLLSNLTGRNVIGLVISSKDLSTNKVVVEVLKDTWNRFVLLRDYPDTDFQASLTRNIRFKMFLPGSMITVRQLLTINGFDYNKVQADTRRALISTLKTSGGINSIMDILSVTIASNVHLFHIQRKSISNFLTKYHSSVVP